MRKYVIIISTVGFLAVVLLLGFFADNSSNMQNKEWFMHNGVYYNVASSKPYNGFIIEKAMNKTVVTEINNGEKLGWFKVFNEDNSLEMKGKMINNMNQGKWTYYYSNGNIQSEGNFNNDVPDGKWIWYYKSGKIKEISSFYNGVRSGEYILFDKEGNISERRYYINGAEKKSAGI